LTQIMTLPGVSRLHNHVSQFLIIYLSICLSIHPCIHVVMKHMMMFQLLIIMDYIYAGYLVGL
jgi:hypothetical protein